MEHTFNIHQLAAARIYCGNCYRKPFTLREWLLVMEYFAHKQIKSHLKRLKAIKPTNKQRNKQTNKKRKRKQTSTQIET